MAERKQQPTTEGETEVLVYKIKCTSRSQIQTQENKKSKFKYLKYIATLPCNLSLIACFADINVSQGSVATCARCGGIFDIHLTANLPRNLPVKKILKSVKNGQNYGHESVAPFLAHPVRRNCWAPLAYFCVGPKLI